MNYHFLLIVLLCFVIPSYQVGFIHPIEALKSWFINTQLPSIYSFHFTLDSGLSPTSYIMMTYPNYTTITGPTCLFGINQTNPKTQITCIASANSVYALPGIQIESNDEVYLTVSFSPVVPNTPGQTELLQVSTTSGTDSNAIVFDSNPGYGQMIWQPVSDTSGLYLNVLKYGTPSTQNLQGGTNDASFQIRFSKAFSSPISRLVIVLDSPWAFGNSVITTDYSPLYSLAVAQGQPTYLYLPANISQTVIVNPNMIEVYFNESFIVGREFVLNITNITNPLVITTGKLKFYTTQYASNYVLEKNENTQLLTSSNNLAISVSLAAGIPFVGPVSLYHNTEQYIKINFTLDITVPSGSTITYTFTQNCQPTTGTLYIVPPFPSLTNAGVQVTYSGSAITLSNLGQLNAGNSFVIQTKMLFSRTDPDFSTTVTLNLNGNVLKYGSSNPIMLATNAISLLSDLQGTSGESWIINAEGGQIRVFLSTTGRDTTTRSSLTIYASQYITATSPSCTSNYGTPGTCTVTTANGYSIIKLGSSNANNVIPSNAYVTLYISSVTISKTSNHQNGIFEFYFALDYDDTGRQVKNFMRYAFVRPQRAVLTSFSQVNVGDLFSNTMEFFPAFIRITGTSSTLTPLSPITGTKRLVMTVYGIMALSNLLAVSNLGSFPCGSNLAITCQFIRGSSSPIYNNPLDWDRVILTLPSTAVTTAFNIYFPQFWLTGNHYYEFLVGTFDTATGIYENLYIANQMGLSFYRSTAGFLASYSNIPNMNIALTGQYAGVLVGTPLQMIIDTPSGGYNFNCCGLMAATMMIITSWDLWSATASITSISTPLSSAAQDAIVYLSYTTTTGLSLRAVIWPMIGTASMKTFFIQNAGMPYSLDTPNYNIYLTDRWGQAIAYNQFINGGRNALVTNVITQFNFNCQYMIQGYLNTFCTLTFVPNTKIDLQTKMKFIFSDAFVSISGCTFQYNNGSTQTLSSSQFGCISNLHEIQISFNLNSRLDAGVAYNFSFYGLDHGTVNSQSVTFRIFDANFGYLIEQAYYSYYLEIADTDAITINDIKYDFQNLDAISNLEIDFTIPRAMQANENLDIDIGPSLQGNNLNTNRISLTMKDATGTPISIIGSAKSQIITLQFKQGVLLPKGYYVLKINNIKTPSAQISDEIQVKFRRSTDNVYVLGQLPGAYTPIPTLSLIASANVTLAGTRYICVGCLGQITLQVTTSVAYIDYSTIFYIHFPSYFLPALTNNQKLMKCFMGTDPINCNTETEYPFRLKLYYPPSFYSPGGIFNLTIYGFIIPNAGQSISNNEDLFFSISSSGSNVYTEQSFVKLPQLLSPQTGTGTLFLYKTSYSSLFIKDTSDHKLRINSTGTISNGSIFTVTFTSDYNNLPYTTSLTCAINAYISKTYITGYSSKVCTISGQTVFFTILTTIPKGASLEVIIYSVPNPTVAGLVDPNQFIIASFLSDGNTVTTISSPGLNSAENVTFVQPSNTLSANNGSDITLVKGTFSDFIYLGTLDGTRFKQDVVISARISGFTFLPSTIQFYVGDIGQSFRVGCDKNVKVRTYPLNFTQSEDNSLSNLYGSLFNLRIIVVTTPVVISIPGQIDVIAGGASIPTAISLVNPPYTDMQILIGFDEQYFNGAFGIDYDYSSPSLSFTFNETVRYLAFTTTSSISSYPSTFNITLTLDGTNYESYVLQNSQVRINIISTTEPSPTITGTQSSIGKTFGAFSLTPSSSGTALIQVSTCDKPKSIDIIKNYLRNNHYKAYETTTNNCWQRYSMIVFNSGVASPLNISGLTPATSYFLYVYFENKLKQNNADNLLNFTFTTASKYLYFILNLRT